MQGVGASQALADMESSQFERSTPKQSSGNHGPHAAQNQRKEAGSPRQSAVTDPTRGQYEWRRLSPSTNKHKFAEGFPLPRGQITIPHAFRQGHRIRTVADG